MRLISAVSVLLAACATTRPPTLADQCSIEPSAGWIQLATPPPEANQLFDLFVKGKSVRSQLGPMPPSRRDAWFRSKAGIVRYCRYTAGADPCRSEPESVDFVPSQGTWSTEGALVMICVDADRRIEHTPK